MAPAGEQAQIFLRLGGGCGFGQDAGAGGNHRVGGDDIGVAINGGQFFTGQAQRVGARGFLGKRGFVDFRRDDLVRLDADLP